MKKTYIKPETVSVQVKIENLMNPISANNGQGSITPQNQNAVGAAMGRDGGWDDDDE